MYELGYKATIYYRDAQGVQILARAKQKGHYSTEEESIEKAKSAFPEKIENNGLVGYRSEIESKLYKFELLTCPEGHVICPRCGGSGLYSAPSRYHDNYGVKYCFKCEGLGHIKEK